jgi:PAS domain S-box-containing protein
VFVGLSALFVFGILRWLREPRVATVSFEAVAEEFRESIRIGERSQRRLPLGSALLAATLLGLLLLALGVLRQHVLLAGDQTTRALHYSVAAQVGTSLQLVDLTLSELAEDLAHGALALPDAKLQRVQSKVDTLVRAIWVLDAEGRVVHDSDAGNLGADLSARDDYLHHRDTLESGFFIGSVVNSASTDTWFVSASRPVRSPSGELLGVVVAALDVDRFGRFWDVPVGSESLSVALFRSDATLLLRSPMKVEVIGRNFRQTRLWQSLIPQSPSGSYRNESAIDGEARIYAYGAVPHFPDLMLVVGLPVSDLLSDWLRFAATSVAVLLLLLSALGFLAFYVWRQLGRRVAVQRLASALARYPLNNPSPVLTFTRTGEPVFANAAAKLLLDSANAPGERESLHRIIVAMATAPTAGVKEFSVANFVAAVQDITERKRHEVELRTQRDLYAALSATNEAIIRLSTPEALFARVCRIAVERSGFDFAWIGLVDESTGLVRPTASYGDDDGYVALLEVTADASQAAGLGLAGEAMRACLPQVVNDVRAVRGTAPWHEALRARGIRSVATFPMRRGGRCTGVFALYSRHRDHFNAEVVRLLNEMIADVSFALDHFDAERQRTEAVTLLERAEERWQFALEGGQHGVWEWNPQTEETFFSPQWKRLLGFDAEEIGDRVDEWRERIHPDDLAEVLARLDRHLAGETPVFESEHRQRGSDGQYRWIRDHGKLMTRDAQGRPLSVVGTLTDISASRAVAQKLRESEAMFKGVVEQSLVGIYNIDEHRMRYANPRTASIFGYEPSEILGIELERPVHEEDWPRVQSSLRALIAGERRSVKSDFRARRRDGSTIQIGVHGSRAEFGGKPLIVGVLQDVTLEVESEQRIAAYVARLEDSIMTTVAVISDMVDLRDPYTAGHERRVGELAAAIGGELGWTRPRSPGSAWRAGSTTSARSWCQQRSCPNPDASPRPSSSWSRSTPRRATRSSRTSSSRGRSRRPCSNTTSDWTAPGIPTESRATPSASRRASSRWPTWSSRCPPIAPTGRPAASTPPWPR